MYCAIIGDIVSSRTIENRELVQKGLAQILEIINKEYSKSIAANFTITIGDEFQGLLQNPSQLIKIIDYIKNKFYPNEIKFGIGFGEIKTEIIKDYAIGADGPAYHVAREALEQVKKSKNQNEKPIQDILMYDQLNTQLFKLINATLSLCYNIEKSWTEKQRCAIYRALYSNKSQHELAKEIGLKQSSIHRRLKSGDYFTYKNAKTAISDTIIKVWEQLDGN